MTRDDDFIGQLDGYLDEYEGATPLPAAVRDAIRAELPRTKQIGPLGGLLRALNISRRIPAPAGYGLIAAVIIGAVIIGGALFYRGPDVGGGQEASATPTATATSRTPSPTPRILSATLDAGTYLMPKEFGGVPFSFTVPAGWATDRDSFVSKGTGGGEVIRLTKGVILAAFTVDHVYADACHPQGTIQLVGDSVEALATALGTQLGRDTAGPSAVSVDGYTGQLVELIAPADISSCDGGLLRTWSDVGGDQSGGWPAGPGQTDEVYIVDVDGTRLVIVAAHWADTSPQDLAELQHVLDSIRIE
jgi:hypothetical protein